MTDSENLLAARSLASSWFKIHAEQRLRLMNFYVVLLAGSLTLISSQWGSDKPFLMFVLGVALILITFVFKNLDMRSAGLLKIAEAALNKLEAKLESTIGIPEIRLIQKSNDTKGMLSYRQSFNILFLIGLFLGLIPIGNGIALVCGCR